MAPAVIVALAAGVAMSSYHLSQDVPRAYRHPNNPGDMIAIVADVIETFASAPFAVTVDLVSFASRDCRVRGRSYCHPSLLPMREAQMHTTRSGVK